MYIYKIKYNIINKYYNIYNIINQYIYKIIYNL